MQTGEESQPLQPQAAMPQVSAPRVFSKSDIKKLVDVFMCLDAATRKLDEKDRKEREAHAS